MQPSGHWPLAAPTWLRERKLNHDRQGEAPMQDCRSAVAKKKISLQSLSGWIWRRWEVWGTAQVLARDLCSFTLSRFLFTFAHTLSRLSSAGKVTAESTDPVMLNGRLNPPPPPLAGRMRYP